jgi:molybdate transport system substrate-binding protein
MLRLLCVLTFGLPSSVAHADQRIAIAAASDLKFALDEIVEQFRPDHPDATIDVSYGSSGNFKTQILQRAPFDLYFSADIDYAQALADAGFVSGAVRPYAIGRIVLWSARSDASALTLTDLRRPEFTRIAIANPRHAPYGLRAQQALEALGLWTELEPRIVYGENVAQAAQFVESGNAPIGIIALALAMNPTLAELGAYYLIPAELHDPLLQGFVVTRHGADNPLAHAFAAHIETSTARAVLVRYGFALPGDENANDAGSDP